MTIVEDYAAGRSMRNIALSTGLSRYHVMKELARHGVAARGATEQRVLNTLAADLPVDGAIGELIDGLMLGDGGVTIRVGNCAPTLNLTNLHRDYIDYVAEPLRRHGAEPRIRMSGRGCWQVTTRAWPALDAVAARWYVGTRKRAVPEDVLLTPTALLHWWLGDGGLAKRKGKRPTGYLYTNSFPEPDVRRLVARLAAMGISATANRCGGSQHHEWRIHLSVSGVRALLDMIGPCPVPSYAYKWSADRIHPAIDLPFSRLTEASREALLMIADSVRSQTSFRTWGESEHGSAGVAVAHIDRRTARLLRDRGLIEWGGPVGDQLSRRGNLIYALSLTPRGAQSVAWLRLKRRDVRA